MGKSTQVDRAYACPVCGLKVAQWNIAYGRAVTMNGGWPLGGTVIGAGDFPLPPGYIDKTEPVPPLNEWTFEPCGHQVFGAEVSLREYDGPEPCWDADACRLQVGHDGFHESAGRHWWTR